MNDIDYQLSEIIINSEDLMLDPNNPRIQVDGYSNTKLSESEIVSSEMQRHILNVMHQKEHKVKKLIESMRTNGYVNIDSIFVKKLETTNKYLVLEGNRRTTAIKHLLEDRASLGPSIATSLEKIPVKELICEDTQLQTDMTDFILAIRHLGGVEDWEPMQKAHSVYSTYMRELKRTTNYLEFRKRPELVRKISHTLNQSTKDVEKALRVYVSFDQLKKQGYPVKSDHYTLLDRAVSHYPQLSTGFFFVNSSTFEMSNTGLERFNQLCIEEGCKITNPKSFTDFFHIYRDGNDDDLNAALYSEEDMSTLKKRILNRKDSFYGDLEDIKDAIGKLMVSTYRKSEKEKQLILEIQNLVNQKLVPLICK